MSMSMYENTISRLLKEIADYEKQLGRERDKLARLNGDIGSLRRSITGSTSPSTVSYKQRQIEGKEKDAAQVQKKIAELQTKVADKQTQVYRNTQNLNREKGRVQRQQDTENKRRREDELRHAREVTRQIERQSQLHNSMKGERFVIDLSKLPTKITVLFFAANPIDPKLASLRLDEEIRSIQQEVRASEYRDSLDLQQRWAVRPGDLLQALNELRPHVVHFSGHGSDEDEIIFQDPAGNPKPVKKDAIVQLMNTASDNIRMVLFNTCFSRGQAEAVTEHIDIAIGMNDSIGDEAARIFAAQFYSAIGFGKSVQQAFEQARTRLMLEGIPEEDIPELFSREGVDPSQVYLVRPDGAPDALDWQDADAVEEEAIDMNQVERSLAIKLAEIHEKDWGPGNPGHSEIMLKTITSSEALTQLLSDAPGPQEHLTIVRILERWERKGYVVLARPIGEEVLVTGVNVGKLRVHYNI